MPKNWRSFARITEEALKGLNTKSEEEFGIGQETLGGAGWIVETGRDPREEVAGPILRSDVLKMEDLPSGNG